MQQGFGRRGGFLTEEEKAVLESYAWVDRSAGLARIPIDRAMEIAASKGLPKWPKQGGTQEGGNR